MIAMLFGVMSVLPAPLRALANPAAVHHAPAATAPDTTHHHAAHAAAGHHGHGATVHHLGDHPTLALPAGDEPSAAQPPDGVILCQSAACCVAVTQTQPSAPVSILLLLGQLAVPPARIIVAVTPDPVVPPPRLPV